jgi:phosphate/sulfate permease
MVRAYYHFDHRAYCNVFIALIIHPVAGGAFSGSLHAYSRQFASHELVERIVCSSPAECEEGQLSMNQQANSEYYLFRFVSSVIDYDRTNAGVSGVLEDSREDFDK